MNNINKDQLSVELFGSVKRIAHNIHSKLPANYEIEDLIQDGMLGLLDAIDRYEVTNNRRQFESYAAHRIRGSIFDGIRKCDWVSKHLRKRIKYLGKEVSKLEQEIGRTPRASDIADELNISISEYCEISLSAMCSEMTHLDDIVNTEGYSFLDNYSDDNNNNPLNILIEKELSKTVNDIIEVLPSIEKSVIRMRFLDDCLSLKEIGEVFGFSESRSCQIQKQAISRLNAMFNDVYEKSRNASIHCGILELSFFND